MLGPDVSRLIYREFLRQSKPYLEDIKSSSPVIWPPSLLTASRTTYYKIFPALGTAFYGFKDGVIFNYSCAMLSDDALNHYCEFLEFKREFVK